MKIIFQIQNFCVVYETPARVVALTGLRQNFQVVHPL